MVTLEKAFHANPRSLYGAISFARAKIGEGDSDGAEKALFAKHSSTTNMSQNYISCSADF